MRKAHVALVCATLALCVCTVLGSVELRGFDDVSATFMLFDGETHRCLCDQYNPYSLKNACGERVCTQTTAYVCEAPNVWRATDTHSCDGVREHVSDPQVYSRWAVTPSMWDQVRFFTPVAESTSLNLRFMQTGLVVHPLQLVEPVLPRISCIMVTWGRTAMAIRAIDLFRRQSYPNRELVIVSKEADSAVEVVASTVTEAPVVYVRLPADSPLTLGSLKNLGMERASGDYFAMWEDDDLHDPDRLAVQYSALRQLDVHAVVLSHVRVWRPSDNRVFVSAAGVWDRTLLCAKEHMVNFPAAIYGDDMNLSLRMLQTGEKMALLSAPLLYTVVSHKSGSIEAFKFDYKARHATTEFSGEAATRVVQQMLLRHGLAEPDEQQPVLLDEL